MGKKVRFAPPPPVVRFSWKYYACFLTGRSNATPVFTMLKLTLIITKICCETLLARLKPAPGRYYSNVLIHVMLQWLRVPSNALMKLIEIRCGPIRLVQFDDNVSMKYGSFSFYRKVDEINLIEITWTVPLIIKKNFL